MKEVERRIRTQLLDALRNRRRYWELKEEAEDRNRWKQQFINRTQRRTIYLPKVHGPANKQHI